VTAGESRRRGEEEGEEGEDRKGAGVVLMLCVITLPFLVLFLVIFFGGRGGAPAAWQNATKLAAICGGTLLTDPSFEISSNTVQLAHVCTAIAIRAQNSVQYLVFQKNFAPQLQSRVQIISRNKNQESNATLASSVKVYTLPLFKA
jgi:hypothetical protein